MSRPKQDEIPMSGPGVGPIKDSKLTKLADQFIDVRDQKATLAEELTGIETKILDRMAELGISTYRFADQIMTLKPGATHIKVKTVKVDGEKREDDDAPPRDE